MCSRGDELVIIGHHFDTKHIIGAPLCNRKGTTIIKAWRKIRNAFKRAGVVPRTRALDNEKSKDLMSIFDDEK